MRSPLREFLSDRKADLKEFFFDYTGEPALHGDSEMQQHFLSLMKEGITSIVETGTCRGGSTAFFGKHFKGSVFTCEINPAYYRRAKKYLTPYKNIVMVRGDSRHFLEEHRTSFGDKPLFFLDAHWRRDFPLPEELAFIRDTWPEAIIVIDDFKVPGTNVAYDDSNEIPIDEELIKNVFPRYEITYPSNPNVGYAIIRNQTQKSK